MKALERLENVIRTLIEKRNNLEIYVNCIYKFKILLIS